MKKGLHLSSMVLLMLAWTIVGLAYTECKQLPLLSLTAREVYRLLRQSGRQDAVPEGRVITQGLAAMAGFALGLKKALTGVLIYDFITANVTDLGLGLGNVAANTTSTNAAAVGTRQEICFNSRKSRNLDEADAVAEAYEWLDEHEGKVAKSHRRKSKSYHHRRNKRHNKADSRQAGTTTINDPTTSGVDSPTSVTNPTTTTGSLPTMADDAGTGISTATTTLTGNEAATNCIVIMN